MATPISSHVKEENTFIHSLNLVYQRLPAPLELNQNSLIIASTIILRDEDTICNKGKLCRFTSYLYNKFWYFFLIKPNVSPTQFDSFFRIWSTSIFLLMLLTGYISFGSYYSLVNWSQPCLYISKGDRRCTYSYNNKTRFRGRPTFLCPV